MPGSALRSASESSTVSTNSSTASASNDAYRSARSAIRGTARHSSACAARASMRRPLPGSATPNRSVTPPSSAET
jgi:hypothetical protein